MHLLRLSSLVVLAALVALLATGLAEAGAVDWDGDGYDDVDVLVVGDSLAVGTQPFLGEMLAGRHLVADVRNGITTPQGMRMLRLSLRRMIPRTVVMSLGSNDGGDPRRFRDRLRRTLRLLPLDTCVIWSTIIRPRRKGPYRPLNRVLHRLKKMDPRLVVVDWANAVKAGTAALRDGLHATPDGYRIRSAMIAEAVDAGCPAKVGTG